MPAKPRTTKFRKRALVPLWVNVEPDEREALRRLADQNDRALSGQAGVLIREGLRRHFGGEHA